jgi:single-stranded-DNA-specific exonuclease
MRALEHKISSHIAAADSVLGQEHILRALARPSRQRQLDESIIDQFLSAGILESTARVAAARYKIEQDCFSFLNPKHSPTYHGNLFPNLNALASLIDDLSKNRSKISVVFDYDVDGVTAASQFKLLTDLLGISVTFMTPRRKADGYGVKQWMVDTAIEQKHQAIFTLDCGTADREILSQASRAGVSVVVIDHHQVTKDVPDGLMFNPFFFGIDELKVRCASGLVHDLVCEMLSRKNLLSDALYDQSLSLATLGTIADVMSLTGVNRSLVSQGLGRLTQNTSEGIQALRVASQKRGAITVSDVGYHLGPRINAAGRLDEVHGAMIPFELLTSDDPDRCRTFAGRLEEANINRRAIEADCVQRALELCPDDTKDGYIIYDEAADLGVVGLVASRLTTKYDRPCLVVGADPKDATILKGSLRAPEGYSGIALLESCKDLLIGFGGHERAGGMVMQLEKLPELSARFNEAALQQRLQAEAEGRLQRFAPYDDEISLQQLLDPRLLEELRSVGPYGEGFSLPSFLVRGVELQVSDRRPGAGAIFLHAREGDSVAEVRVKGIANPSSIPLGQPVDLVLSVMFAGSETDSRHAFVVDAVSQKKKG